jgi:glyoxylase-like metal-dependent hydrolase (beta-lactamase superfamily II)
MGEKKFKVEKVGFLEVNCYIIPSEEDDCVYIIDPGASPDKIAEHARSFGFNDFRIILTHAHIDHISALKETMDKLETSFVYLHKDDMGLYKSPANELQPLMPALKFHPEPVHSLESGMIEVIHTPGHTQGGVSFYIKKLNAVFTGDTLFRQSIGRTDFPGGCLETLISSINNRLFILPEETEVFPGHGPSSSIGEEKRFNPFL